ncbi:transposase [Nocardiopsis sp. MG754419]|uniref:transposase n=1 Tax=Nocardiopsis sp. MG754419 TaxID=2259865 RepID=UPI001BA92043|nr:hypothetical protein [Nocardiopsis sp. MG754419]
MFKPQPRHCGIPVDPRQDRGEHGAQSHRWGKGGSRLQLLCDNQGLPLSYAISAANVNDGAALKALIRTVPAV